MCEREREDVGSKLYVCVCMCLRMLHLSFCVDGSVSLMCLL